MSEANLNPSPTIELSRLQDILESISKIGRLSMVAVDFQGNFLTKPSGIGGFCRQAELNPLTFRCCQRSREFGLTQALARGEKFYHFCPFGFLETTVPIICDQTPLAAVSMGQIRCGNAPVGLVDLFSTMAQDVNESLKDPILKAFHDAAPTRDFHELDELASMLERLGCFLALPKAPVAPNQIEPNAAHDPLKPPWPTPDSPKHTGILARERVNPSFLISALSALANLSVLEGAWKTNRMAILLAEHLKSAEQDALKDFKALSDELADAERYLAMQELRYGDHLTFKLNAPSDLLNHPVPIDSLLAATERAVCFGLRAGQDPLEVQITARRQGRDLLLEVKDNLTSGRSPMEELMASPFQNPSETLGIAQRLETVRQRLFGHYGKASELLISPGPRAGSICQIRLPIGSSNPS
ncbi:MAG: PocR ligand-binding domain-containing protein [Deltaproteobacteria bacterium]|nr:PocR ligand-binding domain-containing protein [Deltaproteobacteria bacterium]